MTDPAPDVAGRVWSDVTWAVVDVEGNGQPGPDLVEVAVVTIREGAIDEARSWLVRPPRPVTWRARQIHGLSDQDLQDAPTVEQITPEVLAALAGADVVAGHQVGVDLGVLRRAVHGWPHLPAVDTLRLARAQHPDLPSHRLGALADHLGLADGLPGPAHRAAYDATVTARLFLHLVSAMPEPSVADLLDGGRTARPGARPRRDDHAPPLFEVP